MLEDVQAEQPRSRQGGLLSRWASLIRCNADAALYLQGLQDDVVPSEYLIILSGTSSFLRWIIDKRKDYHLINVMGTGSVILLCLRTCVDYKA